MMIILKLLIMMIGVYVGIMLFMYVFQRNFTFHPSADNPFHRDHRPFQPFVYQTPLGMNLRGLRVAAKPGMPTIVYFHGNAGNLADRIHKAVAFTEHGYGMVLVGYRGYSGNPGRPSEQGFYEDGRAVLSLLLAEGMMIENIVLYGESLGTGVATQMATEYPQARALVLEAPFTSTVAVAKKMYGFLPVNWLMKDRFDNASKIGTLKMPIIIVHGTKDRTVAYAFGKELFSHVTSPRKEFITLEGAGHADLYDFETGQKIYGFLSAL